MIKKYEDGIGREMLLVQSTERCVLDKKLHFSIKYKNNFLSICFTCAKTCKACVANISFALLTVKFCLQETYKIIKVNIML